jgi:hypothetical protein
LSWFSILGVANRIFTKLNQFFKALLANDISEHRNKSPQLTSSICRHRDIKREIWFISSSSEQFFAANFSHSSAFLNKNSKLWSICKNDQNEKLVKSARGFQQRGY